MVCCGKKGMLTDLFSLYGHEPKMVCLTSCLFKEFYCNCGEHFYESLLRNIIITVLLKEKGDYLQEGCNLLVR